MTKLTSPTTKKSKETTKEPFETSGSPGRSEPNDTDDTFARKTERKLSLVSGAIRDALDELESENNTENGTMSPEQKLSLVSGAIQSALKDFENLSASDSEDENDERRFCVKRSSVMEPVPLRSTHRNLYKESSFRKSAAEFLSNNLTNTASAKPRVTFQPEITAVYTAKQAKSTRIRDYNKYARSRLKTAPTQKQTQSKPKRESLKSDKKKNEKKQQQQQDTTTIGPKEYWLNTGILDDTQTAAFRKLFSRFDKTKSGGISGDELHSAVKELMPERDLSYKEVELILKEFDIKCTGEIEFDEFLYAMTHPKNYIKLIQDDDIEKLQGEVKAWDTFQSKVLRKKHLSRQLNIKKLQNEDTEHSKIFFKMLQTATKDDSMHEIRHFYVNKIKKMNDHVIHDWSAGQRCVGLSDEDVIRRYEDIFRELKDKKLPFLREKKYIDSPYAKPLQWGLAAIKATRVSDCLVIFQNTNGTTCEAKCVHDVARVHLQTQARERILKFTPKLLKRNSMGRSKSFSIVKSQDKESDVSIEGDLQKQTESKKFARPVSAKNRNQAIQRTQSAPHTSGTEKIKQKPRLRTAPLQRMKISEFEATPKVVPLPTFCSGDYPKNFNYDHNSEIRAKAAAILEKYYNDLKKVSATNSKAIYKQLHVEHMTKTLRRHFKNAYLAYSGEYEPFVVSPWIPSPTPSPWIPYPPLAESTNVRNSWS